MGSRRGRGICFVGVALVSGLLACGRAREPRGGHSSAGRRESAARGARESATANPRATARAANSAPPAALRGEIPVRLLPVEVSVESVGSAPAAAIDGWRLFDGDGTTTIGEGTPALRLRVRFDRARRVEGVGVFTRARGAVSISATRGSATTTIADHSVVEGRGASGRWDRVVGTNVADADELTVEWTPADGASGIGELQLWGLDVEATSRAGAPLADQLVAGLAHPAVEVMATPATIAVSPPDRAHSVTSGTVRFELGTDPRAVRRAFLTYELAGLPHFSGALRTINGHHALGGTTPVIRRASTIQVEEIAPALLRRGRNEIDFLPVRAGDPIGYTVTNLRVGLFGEGGEEVVEVANGATTATAMATTATARRGAPGTGRGTGTGRVARQRAAGTVAALDLTGNPAPGSSNALTDGNLETGATGSPEAGAANSYELAFDGPRQAEGIAFHVARAMSGTIEIAAVGGTVDQRQSVTLDGRAVGWHRVALGDGLGESQRVRVTVHGPSEHVGLVSEVRLTASELPRPAGLELNLSHPLHGECTERRGAELRGFVSGSGAALRNVQLLIDGNVLNSALVDDGAFAALVPPPTTGARAAWHVQLAAIGGDGSRVERTVDLEPCTPEPVNDPATNAPIEDVGAPFGVTVRAGVARTVNFGDASLDVPAGALEHDTRITVRPLLPTQMPELEAGMTNVTPAGHGYRFGPHHLEFQGPARLRLAYDASRIPPGLTEADVGIYYYDDASRHWREVTVIREPARGEVVAATAHFTDFIAGVMPRPESAQPDSFNPNRIRNLDYAQPGAGVTQIEPPSANSSGTANLSYPIAVPPGRNGMQPSLAITYSNERAGTWLGTGWDLEVSHIEIDTRFGVPRYASSASGTCSRTNIIAFDTTVASPPEEQTLDEAYLLDGAALTRVGPEPGGGVRFQRRVEGSFEHIVRLGNCSDNYRWVITDRNGVRRQYGTSATSRLAEPADSSGRPGGIFRWQIDLVSDPFGNRMTYAYDLDAGESVGVPNADGIVAPGEHWQQLYPISISYTEHLAAGSVDLPARFSVRFNRQSVVRPDVLSSARAGFDVRTRHLLESIDVTFDDVRVRRYELSYRTGDFDKSLLDSIAMRGASATGAPDTNVLHRHRFTYNTAPRHDIGDAMTAPGFEDPAVTPPTTLAVSTHANDHASVGGNVFLGYAPPGCMMHFGPSLSLSGGIERTGRATVDANGDGLPDVVDAGTSVERAFSRFPNRADIYVNGLDALGHSVFSGMPTRIGHPIDLSQTLDLSLSIEGSVHAFQERAGAGFGFTASFNRQNSMLIDADGDGFVDLVRGPRRPESGASNEVIDVLENPFSQGTPPSQFGVLDTGGGVRESYSIGRGEPSSSPPIQLPAEVADRISAQSIRTNPVVRWVVEHDGDIVITGDVTRETDRGGPVIAVINHQPAASGSTLVPVWRAEVPEGMTRHPPGSVLTVHHDDQLYFRVFGDDSGSVGGPVNWQPHIEYVHHDCTPGDCNVDPSILPRPYDFHSDFRVAAIGAGTWTAPAAGVVTVEAAFALASNSLGATFRVVLRRLARVPDPGVPIGASADDVVRALRGGLSPSTEPPEIVLVNEVRTPTLDSPLPPLLPIEVNAGDELYFRATVDPSIDEPRTDPGRISWQPTVRYQRLCRNDSDSTTPSGCPLA